MQSQSYSSISSDLSTSVRGAESRQLNDEVLQSAEEAVLVEAAAPDAEIFTPSGASPADSSALHVRSGRLSTASYKNAVRQHVAASPYQSALLAAAAGALVAVLLRAKWRKRASRRA